MCTMASYKGGVVGGRELGEGGGGGPVQLATVLAVPASPVQGRIHQPTCTHLVAVQYNSYNAVQHYKTHLHSLVGVVLVAVQLGEERGNVGGELAARQASDPSKAKRSPAPSVECLQV